MPRTADHFSTQWKPWRKTALKRARRALNKFEKGIDAFRLDERAPAGRSVVNYVEALERGANDKKRRADRHIALTEVIRAHFTTR